MKTLLLYALAVVIWGSTWIMMKYQLGVVDASASVAYRYLGAGLVLLAGAAVAGKRVRLTGAEHLWCAAQGALMFGINYWLTYLAAAHITSGIIAVFFAGTSALTMLFAAVLTRTLPAGRAILGALLGIAGIALVFWPEVARVAMSGPEMEAGLLVLLSVSMFATGGLVGARNGRAGMPRFATIGWAMVYGGLVMCALVVVRGETFGIDLRRSYILSFLWLTLLASVVVFILYFTLVERIGAEKASYATVLFPLVALGVSTIFEDYHWPWQALIGVPLALAGNALVLTAGSPVPGRRPPEEPEPVEWPVNIVDLPEVDEAPAADARERPLFPQ